MKNEIFQSQQGEIDDIVAKILDKLPDQIGEEVIEFPTGKDIYQLEDKDKPITIRPMTFEDEKILANVKDPNETIKVLLSRCLGNVEYSSLIPSDRIYALIKLRSISISPVYNTRVICENCEKENQAEVNLLEDFPIKQKDLEPTSEVTLKSSGIKVVTRLARVLETDNSENVVLNELWRFVQSIDGHSNKAVIHKVLEKLPREDIHQIIAAVVPDVGIDAKFIMKCSGCGKESIQELNISNDFFTVNSQN